MKAIVVPIQCGSEDPDELRRRMLVYIDEAIARVKLLERHAWVRMHKDDTTTAQEALFALSSAGQVIVAGEDVGGTS